MTVMDHEAVSIEEIVGEVSQACDNSEHEWCPGAAPEWVAYVRCPDCRRSQAQLWCDPCVALVTVTEDGFECAMCEAAVFPARRFVERFERWET